MPESTDADDRAVAGLFRDAAAAAEIASAVIGEGDRERDATAAADAEAEKAAGVDEKVPSLEASGERGGGCCEDDDAVCSDCEGQSDRGKRMFGFDVRTRMQPFESVSSEALARRLESTFLREIDRADPALSQPAERPVAELRPGVARSPKKREIAREGIFGACFGPDQRQARGAGAPGSRGQFYAFQVPNAAIDRTAVSAALQTVPPAPDAVGRLGSMRPPPPPLCRLFSTVARPGKPEAPASEVAPSAPDASSSDGHVFLETADAIAYASWAASAAIRARWVRAPDPTAAYIDTTPFEAKITAARATGAKKAVDKPRAQGVVEPSHDPLLRPSQQDDPSAALQQHRREQGQRAAPRQRLPRARSRFNGEIEVDAHALDICSEAMCRAALARSCSRDASARGETANAYRRAADARHAMGVSVNLACPEDISFASAGSRAESWTISFGSVGMLRDPVREEDDDERSREPWDRLLRAARTDAKLTSKRRMSAASEAACTAFATAEALAISQEMRARGDDGASGSAGAPDQADARAIAAALNADPLGPTPVVVLCASAMRDGAAPAPEPLLPLGPGVPSPPRAEAPTRIAVAALCEHGWAATLVAFDADDDWFVKAVADVSEANVIKNRVAVAMLGWLSRLYPLAVVPDCDGTMSSPWLPVRGAVNRTLLRQMRECGAFAAPDQRQFVATCGSWASPVTVSALWVPGAPGRPTVVRARAVRESFVVDSIDPRGREVPSSHFACRERAQGGAWDKVAAQLTHWTEIPERGTLAIGELWGTRKRLMDDWIDGFRGRIAWTERSTDAAAENPERAASAPGPREPQPPERAVQEPAGSGAVVVRAQNPPDAAERAAPAKSGTVCAAIDAAKSLHIDPQIDDYGISARSIRAASSSTADEMHELFQMSVFKTVQFRFVCCEPCGLGTAGSPERGEHPAADALASPRDPRGIARGWRPTRPRDRMFDGDAPAAPAAGARAAAAGCPAILVRVVPIDSAASRRTAALATLPAIISEGCSGGGGTATAIFRQSMFSACSGVERTGTARKPRSEAAAPSAAAAAAGAATLAPQRALCGFFTQAADAVAKLHAMGIARTAPDWAAAVGSLGAACDCANRAARPTAHERLEKCASPAFVWDAPTTAIALNLPSIAAICRKYPLSVSSHTVEIAESFSKTRGKINERICDVEVGCCQGLLDAAAAIVRSATDAAPHQQQQQQQPASADAAVAATPQLPCVPAVLRVSEESIDRVAIPVGPLTFALLMCTRNRGPDAAWAVPLSTRLVAAALVYYDSLKLGALFLASRRTASPSALFGESPQDRPDDSDASCEICVHGFLERVGRCPIDAIAVGARAGGESPSSARLFGGGSGGGAAAGAPGVGGAGIVAAVASLFAPRRIGAASGAGDAAGPQPPAAAIPEKVTKYIGADILRASGAVAQRLSAFAVDGPAGRTRAVAPCLHHGMSAADEPSQTRSIDEPWTSSAAWTASESQCFIRRLAARL